MRIVRLFISSALAAGAILFASSCSSGPKADADAGKTYVCAYVWPSCHDDPLGHKWLWEEGIGEWEVIKQGDKRFPEHYQPRQPLWGYGLDNDPEVVERWIQTALKYGINTFIYDWYWYNDPRDGAAWTAAGILPNRRSLSSWTRASGTGDTAHSA